MNENKKILIADDEPEVVQLCTLILEKENFKVVSIGNGGRLIDKIKEEKPDLVILDVMLPGIDGYTIGLQMSQDPLLSQIPIIVISALKPSEKLFTQFKQVKNFFGKPFSMDELIQAIRKALNI